MKKLLSIAVLLFMVVFAFGQKKSIGLYLKDVGADDVISFTTRVLPELEKNSDIDFVIVDTENYKDAKVFKYLLNVTSDRVTDEFGVYDVVKEESKEVKGKDGKTKTVKNKVRLSGVDASFSTSFVVRLIDVSTNEFLFGLEKAFKDYHRISDKAAHTAMLYRKQSVKQKAIDKLLEKHQGGLNKFRQQSYSGYDAGAVATLVKAASSVLYEPAVVEDITKEKKGKAKEVRMSGDFYAVGDVFAAERSDGSWEVMGFTYADPAEYKKNHLVSVRLGGRKKLFKAFQEGRKIIATTERQLSKAKKCGFLDREIHIATILDGDPQSILFARSKKQINAVLASLPNVKVYERQDIPDLSKLIASEEALDDENAFDNRDKLVGVDYLFLAKNDYFEMLDVESDVVKRKNRDVLKTDGSIKGNLKMSRDVLKSLFKSHVSFSTKVSATVADALGIKAKISEIDSEKKGKAKHVLIEYLGGLDLWKKYKVYRIDEEKVGDKVLEREVLIGEVKTNKELPNCMTGAKVKSGGKRIFQAISEGKIVIVKPDGSK